MIKNKKGQIYIEFLIAFPITLIFILSIIQFSLIWNAKHFLQYAGYISARSIAVYPGNLTNAQKAAIIAMTPVSGKIANILHQTAEKSLEEFGIDIDLSFISDIEDKLPASIKLAQSIAEKYYYSSKNTEIKLFNENNEEVDNLNPSEKFSIEIVYRFHLAIPIVNAIIGKREKITQDLPLKSYFIYLKNKTKGRVEPSP